MGADPEQAVNQRMVKQWWDEVAAGCAGAEIHLPFSQLC